MRRTALTALTLTLLASAPARAQFGQPSGFTVENPVLRRI